MKEISMKDLHDHLKNLSGNEIILDVRGRDEFAEGHVPGSRNIPHDEVGQHAEELAKFERIYMHCRSGKRAQIAHETLRKLGVNNIVCVASGGMLDWLQAGYEIEKA